MKKVLLIFAAAGLLLATPSCKKGENDPFLSLKSRKGRLAGEYEIESWYSNSNSTDSDDYTQSSTVDIENGSGTATITYDGPDVEPTTQIQDIVVDESSFVVDKDGTWSRTFNTTKTWRENGDGFFVDYVDYSQVTTLKESGTWSFLGGQPDEFKNKERVMLSVLASVGTDQTATTTEPGGDGGETAYDEGVLYTYDDEYADGENSVIYEIDMLKNKEMVFIQDNMTEEIYESEIDGDVYIYSMSQTGETEIKFVQD